MGVVALTSMAYSRCLLAPLMLLVASTAAASDPPDPQHTSGALNPGITEATIHQRICVRGWTKTVQPPAYFINRLKKRRIRLYGYDERNL